MTDKSIEQLAEEKYTYKNCRNSDERASIYMLRSGFIDGYKDAIESIPKEDNEAWAEKLYKELQHIYDSYSDNWTSYQNVETAKLLRDFKLKNK